MLSQPIRNKFLTRRNSSYAYYCKSTEKWTAGKRLVHGRGRWYATKIILKTKLTRKEKRIAKVHCNAAMRFFARPKGFAKPRPRNAPPGRFCPAGRKARGTGCSNPFFYYSIKSMQNKRAAPYKVLLLVRPGGFEPLAFRVGELRQDGIDRRRSVKFVAPA